LSPETRNTDTHIGPQVELFIRNRQLTLLTYDFLVWFTFRHVPIGVTYLRFLSIVYL